MPEEGQRTYQLKHCGNNNKDKDNSLESLNDKNHQASSKKFRQVSLKMCLTKSAIKYLAFLSLRYYYFFNLFIQLMKNKAKF